ncbi:uncharacterized protein FFB20_04232 [Fusarium fujikuroi]|nr:uncharacterized protein FFE2_00697 [Fusarium fujikuroi]SCN69855.1 uncharacterized protein FFC1_00693 [Fusarium fujikuroi]SCN72799.1 uncharacterized protein FFB20_04232 [Fusarium fujikuroi]SCN73392.1 uncharacterized protein FFM5_00656 [Fusarium fujikuroi]SCO29055.1 uncharacterized protein FFNC_00696 [Fusarium fujikuroi]
MAVLPALTLALPGLLLEGRAQIFTSTLPFNVVPLLKRNPSVTSPTPSVYLVRASSNSTENTENINIFSNYGLSLLVAERPKEGPAKRSA